MEQPFDLQQENVAVKVIFALEHEDICFHVCTLWGLPNYELAITVITNRAGTLCITKSQGKDIYCTKFKTIPPLDITNAPLKSI